MRTLGPRKWALDWIESPFRFGRSTSLAWTAADGGDCRRSISNPKSPVPEGDEATRAPPWAGRAHFQRKSGHSTWAQRAGEAAAELQVEIIIQRSLSWSGIQ